MLHHRWPVGSAPAVNRPIRRSRKSRVSRGLRTHSLLFTDRNTASLGQLNLILRFRDIPDIRQRVSWLNIIVLFWSATLLARPRSWNQCTLNEASVFNTHPRKTSIFFYPEHWTFFIISFIWLQTAIPLYCAVLRFQYPLTLTVYASALSFNV